jgi:hypothetical protein
MPNAGHLLDLFNAWTPDDVMSAVSSTNLARLVQFSTLSTTADKCIPRRLGS